MGLETAVLHRNDHVWCPGGSGQALGHNPCLYISFIPAAASRWEGAGVWRLQYGPPVHVCVISEQDNTCHIEEGTSPWVRPCPCLRPCPCPYSCCVAGQALVPTRWLQGINIRI
eukprot:gene19939-biopygen7023